MSDKMTEARAILAQYPIGTVTAVAPYGNGHINGTFVVSAVDDANRERRYILQLLNRYVFQDSHAVMDNIERVTAHLRGKIGSGQGGDLSEVLTLIPASDQRYCSLGESGLWRMYDFVDNTVSLAELQSPEMFYHTACAFGDFFRMLADFPVQQLHETIPGFHDTPARLRQLEETIAADPCGRVADVRREIDFALDRRADAGALTELLARGELPLRVTHNDTKLNNVLVDRDTGKGVCVIDLDTVMPGLAAYDFGDAVRCGASTCAEDEQDLDKCGFSLEYYEAYTRGFLERAGEVLTPQEIRSLPVGVRVIALELGMRFLADHLNGDVYFRIHRPDQNLDRARTQFGLVADIERRWDDVMAILQKVSGR